MWLQMFACLDLNCLLDPLNKSRNVELGNFSVLFSYDLKKQNQKNLHWWKEFTPTYSVEL